MTPNTHSQTCWQKGISHVMSGTIFFTCLTSAISALPVALRTSAWQAAPKRRRKGCKNRKKMTGLWQSQSQRLDKSFICEQSDCIEKPGDTQRIESTDWMFRESWRRNSNPDAASSCQGWQKGCSTGWTYRETLSRQKKSEKCRTRIPRISRKPGSSRKFKRLGNRRQILATSFFMYHQTVYLTRTRSSRS